MGLKTDRETTQQRDRRFRLALNGDQEALGGLFVPYMRPLYQVALRLLRSPEDAEDALQDGLLAALQHLGDFRGRSKFSTWLTRIVVNAALMRLRKSRSKTMTSIDQELDRDDKPLAGRIADPGPSPEEVYEQKEQFRILEQRWQGLPAAYRSALWLRDVQGMGTSEAAEVLGLPEGTLKARLHRGRLRIITEVRRALVPRQTFERAPGTAASRWHRPSTEPMTEVTAPAA